MAQLESLKPLLAYLCIPGPQHFSEIIGKSLETYEILSLTTFTSVPVALPEIDKFDLSANQNYLLDISKAVSSGE